MRFMHELEEFIHDSLEEFPVRLEESRVLTDDVHDVRCANRLVILAPFHFGQAQEILDHGHEESLFRLLVCSSAWLRFRRVELTHSTGYRPDGPTEGVQVVP